MVVDASALVEWVLRTSAGLAVAAELSHSEGATHAPSFSTVEAASALRRLEMRRIITGPRAEVSFLAIRQLRLVPHDPHHLLGRAWALRPVLTSYDAVYVALAEALQVPLLTCDSRLARSHGHAADIRLAG